MKSSTLKTGGGASAKPGVSSAQGLGFSKVGDSKRGNGAAGGDGGDSRAQLVDQYGRIVTPLALVPTKGPADARRPDTVAQPVGSSRVSESDGGQRMDAMSVGGFSESVGSDKDSEAGDDDARSVAEQEDAGDERKLVAPKSPGGVQRRPTVEAARERVTAEQLDALVSVMLVETETVTLFHAPAVRFLSDGPEAKALEAENTRYDAAVAMVAKSGADIFPSRASQTLHPSTKSKDVQAVPPGKRHGEAQVSSWDIWDVMQGGGARGGDGGEADPSSGDAPQARDATAGARTKGITSVVDALVSVSLASPGCLLDPDADVQVVGRQAERVLSSHALSEALGMVERSVQQNLYHGSHRLYRSGPAQDLLERLLEAGSKGGHEEAAAIMRAHVQTAAPSSPGRGKGRGHDSSAADGGEEEDEEEEEAGVGFKPTSATTEGKEEGEEGEDGQGRAQEGSAAAGGDGAGAAGDGTARPELDALTPAAPGMQRLFSYLCPAVKGLNVNCMTWNKRMRDLLAVGYGPYDFAGVEGGEGGKEGSRKGLGGLIALWTMANPEQPQAVLKTPDGVGVTSIDFSSTMPNVLAAGLYDGTIALWDVAMVFTGRSDGSPSLISDKLSLGAHSEAVWQVQWVTKAGDSGSPGRAQETLVSISTDGKVTEWSINKGLQAAPLMTLKRARAVPGSGESGSKEAPSSASTGKPEGSGKPGDALGAEGSEGLLSRTACGLCLDFNPEDPTLYYLGTEDGLLARCSTSYAEQYLDVVSAHAGPVNRTRLSPFQPSALLTGSSDGTCKLWNVGPGGHAFDKAACIGYTPEGAAEAVADVAWSPSVSTRFASVSRDGHVTVWDVGVISKPALDRAVTIEEEDYRAAMDAQCAASLAGARRVWAEERAKMRASMGDDEPDDPALAAAEESKDEDLQAAMDAIREAFGSKPSSTTVEGKEGSGSRRKAGGKRPGGFGMSKYNIPPPAPGPEPKKLSCVLFADNTHVLLTGDASGRVDVYRLTGLSGAEDGSGAPPVGSEAHVEQLEALRGILTTV